MDNIENVLKALSDETRLRIINILYEKELCVCDITETLKITQTKASRHLGYLKNSGLLVDRKQAQWVHYSLSDNEGIDFIENLVLNTLRKNSIYQTDLINRAEWLKKKNIDCD
nr:metalloregulator ArsR/SmtB family transcription factor [uncultured Aminipila sp.]